ncbi:MAG: FAS1-like dehydratase domain-containing protein [Pseudomonadales bacterium]
MSASQAEQQLARNRKPWVTCATPDAIQHFAWGIGDDNPLWRDVNYGRASHWGGLVAPPCFYYAVHETTIARGYPDRRRLYHSVDWTFHDILPATTPIEAECEFIEERTTEGGIDQRGRIVFRTPDGQRLATAVTCCTRALETAPSIEARPELRYSGDELNEIERLVLASERRGGNQRQWEATPPGEELGPLIKGPLSIMDVVAWCAATTGVVTADAEHSEGGLHEQCATGPQLVTWMSQLVTDWMGDDAFLHRLQVEVHDLPPLGSTTYLHGRVSGIAIEPAGPTARVDLSAVDKNGALIASGVAKVLQPSAEHGPVQLPVTA